MAQLYYKGLKSPKYSIIELKKKDKNVFMSEIVGIASLDKLHKKGYKYLAVALLCIIGVFLCVILGSFAVSLRNINFVCLVFLNIVFINVVKLGIYYGLMSKKVYDSYVLWLQIDPRSVLNIKKFNDYYNTVLVKK